MSANDSAKKNGSILCVDFTRPAPSVESILKKTLPTRKEQWQYERALLIYLKHRGANRGVLRRLFSGTRIRELLK